VSQHLISRPSGGHTLPWQRLPVLALLWVAVVYFLIVPLFWPRGEMGWGHHRFRDLILGLPIALAALWMSGVWLAPARFNRALQLRLITAAVATGVTLVVFDAAYLLGVQKVWQGSFWYDELGVTQTYNSLDPDLGYRRKPHLNFTGMRNMANGQAAPWFTRRFQYRSDEHGFRNPPGIRQADVVFIGDSFTEACQVAEEETFTRQVETRSGLRVVNLGLSGYGPQQELLVLRRYGLAYRPGFVVWQLWEGNDLADAERYLRWKRDPSGNWQALTKRCYSESLLVRLLNLTRKDVRVVASSDEEATLRQTDGLKMRLQREPAYIADASARHPVGLADTERAIEEGFRLCRARGIEQVVLFIPLRSRVLEPYIDYDNPGARDRAFPDGSVRDRRDMGSRLAAFCQELGCPAIDLLPAMRAAAAVDNRRLYLLRDPHLDVDGHALVAQQVMHWLTAARHRGGEASNHTDMAHSDHSGRSIHHGQGGALPGYQP
jgi:hypothetical protein